MLRRMVVEIRFKRVVIHVHAEVHSSAGFGTRMEWRLWCFGPAMDCVAIENVNGPKYNGEHVEAVWPAL